MHSAYEECRADTIALYLSKFDQPYEIFFPDQKDRWEDIYYGGWLDTFYGAVKGLQYYDPEKKLWGQAHVQSNFAILQAVRKVDPSIVYFDFVQKDGKDWFYLQVDRAKLRNIGHGAIKDFLFKLHIYKSIGDSDSATKLFNEHSEVSGDMLKIREIVVANRQPRRLEVQPNLIVNPGDRTGKVEYKSYPGTLEGIIESYNDRFKETF